MAYRRQSLQQMVSRAFEVCAYRRRAHNRDGRSHQTTVLRERLERPKEVAQPLRTRVEHAVIFQLLLLPRSR